VRAPDNSFDHQIKDYESSLQSHPPNALLEGEDVAQALSLLTEAHNKCSA
jgi:predicted oxidoreductase